MRLRVFLVVAATLLLGGCATRYQINSPRDANALSDKAFAMFEDGNSRGALAALNAVIAHGSIEDKDYSRRATVEAALKQYAKALADNARAIEFAPHDWHNHLQRAVLHQRVQQFDDAVADLDKAVYEAPTQLELVRRRAYLKVVTGRFRDAAADYDYLTGTPSQAAFGTLGRGVALYLDGAWKEAAGIFGHILERDPDDGLTALWLAKSSLRAGLTLDPARFTGKSGGEEPASWALADILFTAGTPQEAAAKAKVQEAHGVSPCEQMLFVGAWGLLRARGEGAARAFAAANKECPVDSIEGAEARAELARLAG